ncbi:MAG: hypothetical protein ACM3QZ_10490 [Solirubrobacterales bacterium]
MMKKAILIVVALAIVAGGAVYAFNTPEPEPQKHQKAEIVKDPLVTPEVYAIPATFDTIQVTPAKAEAEVKPEIKPAPKPEPKPVAVKPAPVVKPVEQSAAKPAPAGYTRGNTGYLVPAADTGLKYDDTPLDERRAPMQYYIGIYKGDLQAQYQAVYAAISDKFGSGMAEKILSVVKTKTDAEQAIKPILFKAAGGFVLEVGSNSGNTGITVSVWKPGTRL